MPQSSAALQLLFDPADLPSIGPEIRPTRMPEAKLDQTLTRTLSGQDLPPLSQNLIRSLALLWHDHFEESHTLCQDISTPDGSFIHGILHRREPDYGNARYWFNRVGHHPVYPMLAERLGVLQAAWKKTPGDSLCFMPSETWDPFALIDACRRARETPANALTVSRLQQVQELEFRVLIEYFAPAK